MIEKLLKKTLKASFVIGLGLCATAASAQYYSSNFMDARQNPRNLNKEPETRFSAANPNGWSVVYRTRATGNKAWSSAFDLPFAFAINNTPVTKFRVGRSGVVSFSDAVPNPVGTVATELPNATLPNNSVMVWGIYANDSTGTNRGDFVITKVFGSAPNRQFWIQFNSWSLVSAANSELFYSIVLEEGTNRISFVQGAATTLSARLTMGIQASATSAWSIPGSPTIASSNTNTASNIDNGFWSLTPGAQPARQVAVYEITSPKVLDIRNNWSAKFRVKNVGTTGATRLTVNYQIDNATPVTTELTVNLPATAAQEITIPTPITFPYTGQLAFSLSITQVNGNDDAYPADNAVSDVISVLPELANKKPLNEIFSSSTCGPCAPGNTNYKNILAANNNESKVVTVKYQQDFPGNGDPYYTSESVNRRGYYGINSIPRMEIDGGWDGNANSYTQALLDASVAAPSWLEITGQWQRNNLAFSIQGNVRNLAPLKPGNNVLLVAITENRTTRNATSNGETEFFHVFRKMLPNLNGQRIDANTLNYQPFELSFTFPATPGTPSVGNFNDLYEDINNMSVTAWVQNLTTREIYNAVTLVQGDAPVSVADRMAKAGGMLLFPNPTAGNSTALINLDADAEVNVTIMNSAGQVVVQDSKGLVSTGDQHISLPTAQLAKGMYVVTIQAGNRRFVQKLSKD